ncbi:hypothetical protein BJV74DRAFT_493713 [Russula compacta]|nr:hypothetical protein BJV74DRAFT_493713 [Russula compacta]
METLRPDALIGHIRNHAPPIWQIQCELSPANKSGSGDEAVIATVATLSEVMLEERCEDRRRLKDPRLMATTSEPDDGISQLMSLRNAPTSVTLIDTHPSKTTYLESTKSTAKGTQKYKSQHSLYSRLSIDHIPDDVLVDIFSFCRPVPKVEDEADPVLAFQWHRERWWCTLVQVCRRWRMIIFTSPLQLNPRLVCTYGTPVANMLANSPPFPLIIDFPYEYHNITAEDEEEIILVLQHRNSVCHIRLSIPDPHLRKLIMAMDGQFPNLEYLNITPPRHDTSLILPKTFQAPHLRGLVLKNFALLSISPLLTTATSLITLSLRRIHLSATFSPNDLLHLLSLMPLLTQLEISFDSPGLTSDLEEQLFNEPIMVYVTLPSLRRFALGCGSAYMRVLLRQITTPLLEILEIEFFHKPILSTPLLQFIPRAENFRFTNATLTFYQESVSVRVYGGWPAVHSCSVKATCKSLDRQVAFAAQISKSLSPVFSAVDYLALEYFLPKWDKETDRTGWRRLLSRFVNVKTLRVPEGLVEELSDFLRSDGGVPPQKLLPELKVLEYPARQDDGDAFMPFVNSRKIAGCPVTLVRL